MKPLIKYPIALFILLLIGYGQVFAPIYWGNSALTASKPKKGSEQIQALEKRKSSVEAIFIEEVEEKEDDRISLKKHSEFPWYFTNAQLQEIFSPKIKCYFSFAKYLSCFSFFRSPYLVFCVFRL